MATEIRIEDHSPEFKSKFEAAVTRGLTKIGMQAEKFAKQHLTEQGAVDTGRLRNSITYVLSGGSTHVASYTPNKKDRNGKTVKDQSSKSYDADFTVGDASEKAVYIGTNVEYAPYVEFGTGRRAEVGMGGDPTRAGMKPRPYLRPAATNHGSVYEKLFKSEFENF